MRERIAGPLRDQMLAALPALRADILGPAGEVGVRDVVGRRFGLFPQPERSGDEWSAWWSDYYDALGDLTHGQLEAGMRAWVKDPTSEFMPKPGKLRELALSSHDMEKFAYKRLVDLLIPREPDKIQYREPEPEPEPADPRSVAEMMAEFKQKLTGNRMPEPKRFKFQAPVDEHGISPEMRALLGRGKSG